MEDMTGDSAEILFQCFFALSVRVRVHETCKGIQLSMLFHIKLKEIFH